MRFLLLLLLLLLRDRKTGYMVVWDWIGIIMSGRHKGGQGGQHGGGQGGQHVGGQGCRHGGGHGDDGGGHKFLLLYCKIEQHCVL